MLPGQRHMVALPCWRKLQGLEKGYLPMPTPDQVPATPCYGMPVLDSVIILIQNRLNFPPRQKQPAQVDTNFRRNECVNE